MQDNSNGAVESTVYVVTFERIEYADMLVDVPGPPSDESRVEAVRCAYGASEMDWRYPDWASLVDPDRLDMEMADNDLVAQLRPQYPLGAFDCIDPEDAALGFCTYLDEDFDELTGLWRAEIQRRRAGASTA